MMPRGGPDEDPLDLACRSGIVPPEQRRGSQANGHPAAAGAPLLPINPATLDGLPVPERRWLVPNWIPFGRVTALYGAGGEGKTLLAQMLATACAIGAPWLGQHARRCNSLLIFCEDDCDEMHRRQADINAHYGCTFADLGAMRWLPRLGDDNLMMNFEGRPQRTPFLDQIIDVARAHTAELIIPDTLADIFGGNESDRGQSRLFAQSVLGYMARETQGAVLALAHPSLSGMNSGTGTSGSTTWTGTFRSHLYLTTPKPEQGEAADRDLRVLTRVKSNAARRDEEIEIRWQSGVFVADQASTGIIASIERRTCQRVFLDLLDKTTAEGQPVSSNSHSGNYAPRLFERRPDRERFKKADFERAMQTAFFNKEIANEPYGRKSDERTRIIHLRNT
jgi:RecA-family ATPase